MKKNDKLIVVLGVVILILAGVGIYYWVEEESLHGTIDDITDIVGLTGDLKEMPDSISVADSCPFYPLIATPLAVNYDEECEQSIIPLYIENQDEPSTAVLKVRSQLLVLGNSELVIDGSKDAKITSLNLAKKYWESSDTASGVAING